MMPEIWNPWNLSLPASWDKGSIAQALEVDRKTYQISPCKIWWYGASYGVSAELKFLTYKMKITITSNTGLLWKLK